MTNIFVSHVFIFETIVSLFHTLKQSIRSGVCNIIHHFLEHLTNGNGDFLDIAKYKLDDIESPIGLYEGDLNEADIICIAWKHSVEATTNQKGWTPFETDAMYIGRNGNFIECMMSDPLIQGYRGCPLFLKGKRVGTLYGSGDEGLTCFFLSDEAIKRFFTRFNWKYSLKKNKNV